MKAGSALLLLSLLLAAAASALTLYALIDGRRTLLLGALALCGLLVCTLLSYRISAQSLRCPLCLGPILLSSRCAHHKDAKTLLGSYRLLVARNILLRNRFCCPYCGEPIKCEAREKLPHRQKRPQREREEDR